MSKAKPAGWKTVRKSFDTLAKAERFQTRLYDKYPCVRLVHSPRFQEDGVYTWEVRAVAE